MTERTAKGTVTGVYDCDINPIHVGDTVELFGAQGEIVFECGAYGVAFTPGPVDWDTIEAQIPIVTGCNNTLCACMNDNFISLWELLWNFNCEEDICTVLRII